MYAPLLYDGNRKRCDRVSIFIFWPLDNLRCPTFLSFNQEPGRGEVAILYRLGKEFSHNCAFPRDLASVGKFHINESGEFRYYVGVAFAFLWPSFGVPAPSFRKRSARDFLFCHINRSTLGRTSAIRMASRFS